MKLTKRQLYVLERAYEYQKRDYNRGCITTCRAGGWSISPNTCKSLVAFGLLAETGMRNEFRITQKGIKMLGGGFISTDETPSDKLAKWNAAAGGKPEAGE